ncbi:MAG: putative TRAP dicarboxylate transporter-DctP subunit, precussor, partial [bacterium 42_11]
MRRKGWLMVFACMLVLLVATGLVYAQEKVYTFTGQSRMPSGNVFYESLVRACKNAEAASGGRLVFKIYPAGAISPATKELDGVHRGVLDFADTCYMYYRDRWPAAPIFTAKPAGMSPSEALLWVLEGGGHELIVEMLKDYNVQILRGAGQLAPPEIFLVTNKPLKSVADLKGMRIRSAGDGAAILDRLGAACTLMPVGEVFEAMHRGVIDAYEVASPAVNW